MLVLVITTLTIAVMITRGLEYGRERGELVLEVVVVVMVGLLAAVMVVVVTVMM